jgi:ATP-dependent Zn protease
MMLLLEYWSEYLNKKRYMNAIDQIKLRVAYHEAGHALCSLAQGYPFAEISIKKNGFEFGRIVPDKNRIDNESGVRQLMKLVVMLFGGLAAESVLLNKQPHEIYTSPENGSSQDMEKVISIGKDMKLSVEEMTTYISDSLNRAMVICDGNRTKLSALASDLLKHETLSYESCKKIYERS